MKVCSAVEKQALMKKSDVIHLLGSQELFFLEILPGSNVNTVTIEQKTKPF